ncbi:MAG: acetyltransferase [Gammaproteobacteria bacterium]|nr:acetyltransferase [Gammaproteobacteria bacterium]
MYLRHTGSGDLVEVADLSALFDPCQADIRGRIHAGEELQDPAMFAKTELVFPSGEGLPRCWMDRAYRAKLKIA